MEGFKKNNVTNKRTRHNRGVIPEDIRFLQNPALGHVQTRQGVVEIGLVSMIPNKINNINYGNIDDQLTLMDPRRVNARPQLSRVKRGENHINEAIKPVPDGSRKLTVEEHT